MPTYEFKCNNTKCNNEWEDFRSIVAPLPECPKCNGKEVIHLISGGSGKGKVELGAQEYREKVKQDAADFKRQVYKDEKLYSNLTGEAKYQEAQTRIDKSRR